MPSLKREMTIGFESGVTVLQFSAFLCTKIQVCAMEGIEI